MDRPLVFAFLDSWHADPESGSGTTVAIDDLEAGLRALGHRVVHAPGHRIVSAGGGEAPGAGAGPGTGAGPGGSILRRLLYNLRAARRIPPDAEVVVGFDMDGFLLPLLGPRCAERAPRVVALKGVAADEARFESGFSRHRLRLLAALERASARRADLVVTPSEYSARQAVERYGVPASRVAVVPEGIDLDPWEEVAARAGPPPARPTVLSVARQYPRKNTLVLLEALPRVAERVPDVRLRIVGDGPLLPALRRRAARLGLDDRVDFDGALPRDRIREAYFESHCFCLPSLQEGFGIVFLEAMAAGLPIVAARAGAVPEVVRDGEEGILVDGEDPEALAAALVGFLDDPERAAEAGAAGRTRVRAFDRRSQALRFVEAVRPLVRPPARDTEPPDTPGPRGPHELSEGPRPSEPSESSDSSGPSQAPSACASSS